MRNLINLKSGDIYGSEGRIHTQTNDGHISVEESKNE